MDKCPQKTGCSKSALLQETTLKIDLVKFRGEGPSESDGSFSNVH